MAEDEADVVIIGAGAMGTSVAYHLLISGTVEDVVLFEGDPMHLRSSTGLSAGGIRQLFSSRVNIELARYSVSFYDRFAELMAVGDEPGPDVALRENGYLFLLNPENEAEILRRADIQEAAGVPLERLVPAELGRRFPEFRLDDLTGGILGLGDGFLDPYQVLRGFTRKAEALGARIVPEEALVVERESGRATAVASQSHRVAARVAVVDAAGA